MRFHAVPLAILARVTASSTSHVVGRPVTFVITPLAGVPRAGVVSVGLVRVLLVRVSVEFLDTRVSLAPVGSVRVPPETVIAAILGVTRAGEPALTSPPVPVEVAPQRVFTMSATVVSSRTVAAAAVIVVLSGTVRVFIPESEVTSLSIKAPALVTFVVSVTSAPSSTFIIVLTSLAVRASISLHPHAIRHTIVLFGICTILGEPVPDCCTSIECAGV